MEYWLRNMFQEIRFLLEDLTLFHFLWQDMEWNRPPNIYELQHVRDDQSNHEDRLETVHTSFCVDNWLNVSCLPQLSQIKHNQHHVGYG